LKSPCGRARVPGRFVRVSFRQPFPISPHGYDQLTERRFEIIPFWGFLVFLLYAMRRVDCRLCQAVVVEEVPRADGKRTLTKAYRLFLARWARRLSWKETADAFRTSCDKVHMIE
jgi:transposase